MASPGERASIALLPNEILSDIFFYLDSSAPSSSRLRVQPHALFTHAPEAPLKTISLVSKRWRQLILPQLYAHACIRLGELTDGMLELLDKSRDMCKFLKEQGLASCPKTFVIEATETATENISMADDVLGMRIWSRIFDVISPLEVTVCAPPQILGVLTDNEVNCEDIEAFDNKYHLLHLQRPAGSERLISDEEDETRLLNVFPWTHLLLNEGSYINIYSEPEYFLKTTCSILPNLLRSACTLGSRVFADTIRDFSYVAAFPLASHFANFARSFPRLDRFYVQLVPWEHELHDDSLMARIAENDLWVERNSCYATLVHQLFSVPAIGNYRYLQEFESGDAADQDAWNMAVEYVNMVAVGWRVEREGVFVRKESRSRSRSRNPSGLSTPAETAAASAEEPADAESAFQHQLERFAFNGTASLPVSSLDIYLRIGQIDVDDELEVQVQA